jgi:hypothetical protein
MESFTNNFCFYIMELKKNPFVQFADTELSAKSKSINRKVRKGLSPRSQRINKLCFIFACFAKT